ncbi:MAG: hypothetical protein K8F91_11165 [Candidatus Obscuribacterales bacterium]|nr:hypothetical protein [Candidatus Obscuribacterales bacterium]
MPITRPDFERIKGYALQFDTSEKALFRVLQSSDEKLGTFSHSLEKRVDGKCTFLTETNQCALHERFGQKTKPSMCRLFPYTFTATPGGVFASVSFASSAVIFNQGDLLSEKEEDLRQQYALFKSLFPALRLDWGNTQVIDGTDIRFDNYLEAEKAILQVLEKEDRTNGSRIVRDFYEAVKVFRDLVPAGLNLDDMAGFQAPAKRIDQHFVDYLNGFYFPCDIFAIQSQDMDARELLSRVLSGTARAPIKHAGKEVTVAQLFSLSLGRLPDALEDILRRFLYLRVFSKLYFGPGFNYLSIVAGFNHLTILACLLRIRLKLDLLTGVLDSESLSRETGLIALGEHLRTLERRLTISMFSQETVAMLEVFSASPKRVERIISLSA